MDGRGGCCIARYAGGGNAYESNKLERVMLRFRPIAPKPATVSSENKISSSGDTTTYVKAAAGRSGKRKYNTKRRSYGAAGSRKQRVEQINNNNNNKRARADESSGETVVVTLPLLPESPTDQSKTPTTRSAAPIWLSFNTAAEININNNRFFTAPANSQDQAAVIGRMWVVGSGVTVECVTEMWVSGEGLGRTDEERVRNLELDTCPGFVSDVHNRVTWTNRAYKKMVVGDKDKEVELELVVWVAMKEKVPVSYPAFTCRVRVQHTCTKEIKILPCDVWRMDGGGFAWRLDVKAALSLGR